jgi:hypothetical protein
MFCIKCGHQLPEGSGFCHKCGAKLIVEPIPTSSHTPPPAAQTQDVHTSTGTQKTAVIKKAPLPLLDPKKWKEQYDSFKELPTFAKIILGVIALAGVSFGVILLVVLFRLIFSSVVSVMVIATGGYIAYHAWAAKYIRDINTKENQMNYSYRSECPHRACLKL